MRYVKSERFKMGDRKSDAIVCRRHLNHCSTRRRWFKCAAVKRKATEINRAIEEQVGHLWAVMPVMRWTRDLGKDVAILRKNNKKRGKIKNIPFSVLSRNKKDWSRLISRNGKKREKYNSFIFKIMQSNNNNI